jgi:hypothetical protein
MTCADLITQFDISAIETVGFIVQMNLLAAGSGFVLMASLP